MKAEVYHRWALVWRQRNKLEGKQERLLSGKWPMAMIETFRTRKEAEAKRESEYGYIRNRPDLQMEPHGWKMPKVVRVRMTVEVEERIKGK